MLLPTPITVCLSVCLSFYESIVYLNLWVFLLELDFEEQDVRGKIRKSLHWSRDWVPRADTTDILQPCTSGCLFFPCVTCRCVHAWCTWRSKDNVGCLSSLSIFYKTRSPVACPLSARQASPQASRNTGITEAYTMTLHLVFICVLGIWTHILILYSMHLPTESFSRPSSSSVS